MTQEEKFEARYAKLADQKQQPAEDSIPEIGGRYWTRTSDPYRVKG